MKLAVKEDMSSSVDTVDNAEAVTTESSDLLAAQDYLTPSNVSALDEPSAKRQRFLLPATDAEQLTADVVAPSGEQSAKQEDERHQLVTDHVTTATAEDSVGCMIPGCERRHGRMCTVPTEPALRASWHTIIRTVYPDLSLVDSQPDHTTQLKLICEEHFTEDDFDDNGLILAAAMPTRFPGGVKVVYQTGTADSAADSAAADQPVTFCCVPGCSSNSDDKQLFEFPADNYKVWLSVIGCVVTPVGGDTASWLKAERCASTGRPLLARVCQDHFGGDQFSAEKGLSPGAVPTLFKNAKKRVLLKPMANRPKTVASRPDDHSGGARDRVRGPIYVNVTTSGLDLITKSGLEVPLSELSYAELRRVYETLRDKLRVEEADCERERLQLCLSQVEPELVRKEDADDEMSPTSAYIASDIASLQPDLDNAEILRMVGLIRDADKRRRRLDRQLTRLFADSDSYARRAEECLTRIEELQRHATSYDNTYVRPFASADQKQMMMGSEVTWLDSTLNMAANLLEKVGYSTYASLLEMGMPLPPTDHIQLLLTDSLTTATTTATAVAVQHLAQVVVTSNDTGEMADQCVDESAPILLADQSSAPGLDTAESLNTVSADDIHNALMGRGELRDSRGRTVRLSIATPSARQRFVIGQPDQQ